ncbi:MAG TPA: chromosome segregation protein SMC [Nocardioidaceae bacterium]|nr:chromosome segregation protein SMC [Nocardioidaceae bacterium]
MYLKSLTLRGFKSFASSTVLRFEPGITCVVGPNGSGKSNVVDALAWVMGEQGAKSLRGGKMEDVIFAGTSGRPPLGRAEVLLTIDNTDGSLPIDYAEVTISRTMFRSGGSEYAINGQTCRLLDVQELLSDSGIGREMHVIVGQGQLDAILHASPEDRRGFIEEAAGVLKHRKRKEKALRKLDATDGNLTRLSDLLSEIRRQLKPLGRQAEVARRASVVQMEVRDARARLMADDVVQMMSAQEQERADESRILERREQTETSLAAARAAEAELQDALRLDAPRVAQSQETWFALSGLRERLRGTASLAAERLRNAADEPELHRVGPDPDQLESEAAEIRRREKAMGDEIAELQVALDRALGERHDAEAEHQAEDRRIAGVARATADRREGLARLAGQVNSVKTRAAAAADEIKRLADAREEALERAARAQHDCTALETQVAGLDAGERGLDAEHESAVALLSDLDEQLAKLRTETQEAEQERAALAARRDALDLGLSRKDGAGALLAATDAVSGLLGSVAALVAVRPGFESAVGAALGSAADAVAVADADAAVSAIAHLKDSDLGRAGLLLAADDGDDSRWPDLPTGAAYAVDVVEGPDALRPALRRLLFKTAVVDDLRAARALLRDHADVIAVTREGDVLGTHFAAGGSSAQPSLIEVQAALDEATSSLDDAVSRCERLRFDLSRVEAERADAQRRVDIAVARLHESDASMAAVAEQLAQFGALARAAKSEAARIEAAIAAADASRDAEAEGLTALEQRLVAAESEPSDEPDTDEVERLADVARAARHAEMEARLALRTAEERARALHGRADALLTSASAERDARVRAVERRERLRREAIAAEAVGKGAHLALARLERSLVEATQQRSDAESARSSREAELTDVRTRLRGLESKLADLTDSVHRDEMLKAEHRMRMEQLAERALDELGLDLEALVSEYGPDQLIPPINAPGDASDSEGAEEGPTGEAREDGQGSEGAEGAEGGEGGESEQPDGSIPYVRAEQEKRLRSAERALAQLGRINPLALEEFSALEERHKFLTEQLEDLKKTRRDLLEIVREVDARVEEVFTEAYADVEREFEAVFARLFPGGEGRLVPTDPDDMLATGIDVEARPAGKKIKRLSLLSGGERSLVAVAFLVALFKARPSPFYILDEVEAALDDVNLGRLLEIYEELRETSQLIVITHQKRTMEVGDALYGVTMRGDGVSAVISQRLRESA